MSALLLLRVCRQNIFQYRFQANEILLFIDWLLEKQPLLYKLYLNSTRFFNTADNSLSITLKEVVYCSSLGIPANAGDIHWIYWPLYTLQFSVSLRRVSNSVSQLVRWYFFLNESLPYHKQVLAFPSLLFKSSRSLQISFIIDPDLFKQSMALQLPMKEFTRNGINERRRIYIAQCRGVVHLVSSYYDPLMSSYPDLFLPLNCAILDSSPNISDLIVPNISVTQSSSPPLVFNFLISKFYDCSTLCTSPSLLTISNFSNPKTSSFITDAFLSLAVVCLGLIALAQQSSTFSFSFYCDSLQLLRIFDMYSRDWIYLVTYSQSIEDSRSNTLQCVLNLLPRTIRIGTTSTTIITIKMVLITTCCVNAEPKLAEIVLQTGYRLPN